MHDPLVSLIFRFETALPDTAHAPQTLQTSHRGRSAWPGHLTFAAMDVLFLFPVVRPA